MRIWLASYPRSGNTYFRILWHHYYGLPTYSAHNDRMTLGVREIEDLMGHQNYIQKDSFVSLWKTHQYEKDNILPAFYLVRDGREACVSLAARLGCPLEDVICGKTVFGLWSDHVEYWLSRKNRPKVVPFERLVNANDPGAYLDEVVRHCGIMIPRREGAPPTFDELHKKNPKFFRSGNLSSWKDVMTPEQHDLFWVHNEVGMTMTGYKR